MEDGTGPAFLPVCRHHGFVRRQCGRLAEPLLSTFISLPGASSGAINSANGSMNIYGLFQKFAGVFLRGGVDRLTHLGDKCATRWRKAPGRTWPKPIEAADFLPRLTLLENVPDLRRTFLERQSLLLLGDGGTRP